MRYWLKTCPHCRRGDILEEQDSDGRSVKCLRCGYVLTEGEAGFLIGSVTITPGIVETETDRVAA